MTMDAHISLSQEQLQKLSANQIQSLQILSMSAEDLRDMLQKESEENPFMDYHPVSSQNGASEFLNFVAAPEKDCIKNFILEQLNPSQYSRPVWALLTYLAQCVDDNGYLTITEEELTCKFSLPLGLFTNCLQILQQLNPAGICAASLQECLMLQLARQNKLTPLAKKIISCHLDDVGNGRINTICTALHVSQAKLMPVVRLIKRLEPAPLKGMFHTAASYVVPDVIIRFTETGSYEIHLNDSWITSYSLSDYYTQMMHSATDPDIKSYFKEKYSRCYMILHNIERRRKTLTLLTDAIWNWQYAYTQAHHALRPMTLKDISQQTGLHISTISRTIKDKYVQTPWRTVSFKSLFQSPLHKDGQNLSKDAVKAALKYVISQENRRKPYSDSQLTVLLAQQFGVPISRRVIQKYRRLLHIANSYERRILD